jgi:hypothetical protein
MIISIIGRSFRGPTGRALRPPTISGRVPMQLAIAERHEGALSA